VGVRNGSRLLGGEDDLDALVLLVAEHLVAFGGVGERQVVGDDEAGSISPFSIRSSSGRM
jgi:hypothetical protein